MEPWNESTEVLQELLEALSSDGITRADMYAGWRAMNAIALLNNDERGIWWSQMRLSMTGKPTFMEINDLRGWAVTYQGAVEGAYPDLVFDWTKLEVNLSFDFLELEVEYE